MRLFRNFFLPTLFALLLGTSVQTILAQEIQVAENLAADPEARTSVISSKSRAIGSSATKTPLDLTRIGVQTSQPLPISLAEAIRKALEANNTIEISRDDVRFQDTQVRALRGFYDPVFNATPNFTRNSFTHDPATGSSVTRDLRIGTDITQFIRPGGGNYQLFFNNNRTESAFAQAQTTSGSISNSASAQYFSSTGIQYTQPLLRNFSIDARRQNLKIAKKRLDQTDTDFRRQTIETITQVQRTYWDLVFALRDQQNRVANVNLARENLRQIEAKIEAGAAAPLDRAEVATELANREGDLLLATQQVSITDNALKQLVLRDAVSTEWSQSYVPTDNPVIGITPTNLDLALKDAFDNRFELKRLKLQQDINAVDMRYFKNQLKPQIDLNTTFSLDGLARSGSNAGFTTNRYTSVGDLRFFNAINEIRALQNINLPLIQNDPIIIPPSPGFLFGGFNRSLANLFRSDAPNYSIGVTISFPFGNRTAKANLAGARIQEEQIAAQTRSQEQVVIVEVRNAVQAVETARQRVATARRARENAEIQLEGERKLYDAGRSTTFLLFQRENTLTNARNAEIRAETDYSKAIADLQRATATTFSANNIDVQSPINKK